MTNRVRSYGIATAGTALLTLAVLASAHAAEDGARDLMKRVLDAAPTTPFVARMTLTHQGMVRELEVTHKRVNDANATYMEVVAPFNLKDTRFLSFDRTEGADEQYIYLPMAKRSIRVADRTRKQAFLGSDFYVSDMVAPELDSLSYSAKGQDQVGERRCELIEAIPKDEDEELYSKLVFCIDPTDLLIVRTQFFDLKGKPLKLWTLEKTEKIDGIWTPQVQKMANLQESTESQIKITEITYNADVEDEIFGKSHLDR